MQTPTPAEPGPTVARAWKQKISLLCKMTAFLALRMSASTRGWYETVGDRLWTGRFICRDALTALVHASHERCECRRVETTQVLSISGTYLEGPLRVADECAANGDQVELVAFHAVNQLFKTDARR